MTDDEEKEDWEEAGFKRAAEVEAFKTPEGSLGSSSVMLHLYFRKVDEAVARATEAGARATMAPADIFWGDRFAKVGDPFGHCWSRAQHQEDVSPKEMAKRAAAVFPPPPAT